MSVGLVRIVKSKHNKRQAAKKWRGRAEAKATNKWEVSKTQAVKDYLKGASHGQQKRSRGGPRGSGHHDHGELRREHQGQAENTYCKAVRNVVATSVSAFLKSKSGSAFLKATGSIAAAKQALAVAQDIKEDCVADDFNQCVQRTRWPRSRNGHEYIWRLRPRTATSTSCRAIPRGDFQFAFIVIDSHLAHVVQWNETRRPRPARRVPPDDVITDAESPCLVLDKAVDEADERNSRNAPISQKNRPTSLTHQSSIRTKSVQSEKAPPRMRTKRNEAQPPTLLAFCSQFNSPLPRRPESQSIIIRRSKPAMMQSRPARGAYASEALAAAKEDFSVEDKGDCPGRIAKAQST